MVPDSATPGAKNLPLNSDHSGMVKYSSRSDLTYEDVSNNIKNMVESSVERRESVRTSSPISEIPPGRGGRMNSGPVAPRRTRTFLSEEEFEATFS